MSITEFTLRVAFAPFAILAVLYAGIQWALLAASPKDPDYTEEVRRRMEAGEPLWHIEQDLDARDNR